MEPSSQVTWNHVYSHAKQERDAARTEVIPDHAPGVQVPNIAEGPFTY